MRVNELYKQVAELGFATSLDQDARERFYYAANRALIQVAAIRPAIKSCIVNHRPILNSISDITDLEISEEHCFECTGAKAYFFEYCGTGNAYVEYLDGNEWQLAEQIPLVSQGISYVQKKGFIKVGNNFFSGSTRIRFAKGNYLYAIKDLALYTFVYSERVEDIPAYKECSRYDIKHSNPDFWGFCTPPIKEDTSFERMSAGYDIEGEHILLLPRTVSGVYKVMYKHKPQAILTEYDPQNNEDEIDIEEDLAVLLPVLIASYLWIDEEPEKAQYYLGLYRESVLAIERKISHSAPTSIYTNGWA